MSKTNKIFPLIIGLFVLFLVFPQMVVSAQEYIDADVRQNKTIIRCSYKESFIFVPKEIKLFLGTLQKETLKDDFVIQMNNKDRSIETITFEALYRKYFLVFLAFSVIILLLGCGMMWDNIKRRKVQSALEKSKDELQLIYEKLAISKEELKAQNDFIEKQSKEVQTLYQKYETAIQSTNCAVWEMNLIEGTIEISSNFERLFGTIIPLKGNINTVFQKLTNTENHQQIRRVMQMMIDGNIDEIDIAVPLLDAQIKKRWVLIRGKGKLNENQMIQHIYGIFMDVTAEKEKEAFIEHCAKYDFLTGIPNRLDFEETLQEELRNKGMGGIILLDVDDFKRINDRQGHVFGDEILKQIAIRLQQVSHKEFYVARIEGNEFLMLLKNMTDQEQIMEWLLKIKENLSKVHVCAGVEQYVNYSIGITFYPKDSDNVNQLMMNADTAMCKVKQNGKNDYAFFCDEIKREFKERKEIEKIVRISTKEKKFELLYQPQIDMKSGKVVGFEALLRLKASPIGPLVFIPIAEETGDIIEIGRWVAEKAIYQMNQWKEKGFAEKKIAINYSAKQLCDKGYLEFLRELALKYKIKPENIEIEITESVFVDKTEEVKEFLNQLKHEGFCLVLDDFGSGYASLSFLSQTSVSKLKLDKAMKNPLFQVKDLKLMENIISLTHGLHVKITAEEIEDWDTFNMLKKCQCDYCQGFLLCKPINAFEIEKIYNKTYRF